jgi:hypothetical protein
MIYAYCRVSSGRQLEGLSMELQGDTKILQQLADTHNTTVSPDIYQDSGVSSYRGMNLTHGELGRILRDIEIGKIESGDIIVMRSLDRLSRQTLTESEILYNRIMSADVRIYTTIDSHMYIKDDAYSGILKVLSFKLANEESAKKQFLTNKYALHRIEQFQQNDIPDTGSAYDVGVGHHPFWIKLDKKTKIVHQHPIYFNVAKQIVARMLSGDGTRKIIEWLETSYPEREWFTSSIASLHTKDSLFGRLNIRLENKEYQLDGYYSPVCSEAELYQIRKLKKTRTTQSKQKHYSLLSGYERLYCQCGGSVSGTTPSKGAALYRCVRPKPCFSYLNQRVLNHIVLDAIQTHVFVQQEYDTTQLDLLVAEQEQLTDKLRKQQNMLMEDPDLFDASAKQILKQSKDKVSALQISIDAERDNHYSTDLDLNSYVEWQKDVLKYSTAIDEETLFEARKRIQKLVSNIEVNGQLVSITMMDGQTIHRHIIKTNTHNITWSKIHVVDEQTLAGVEIMHPQLLDVYCLESELSKFTTPCDIHNDLIKTVLVSRTNHNDFIHTVEKHLNVHSVLKWSRKDIMNLGITTTQWQDLKDGKCFKDSTVKIFNVCWKNNNYIKKTASIACTEFKSELVANLLCAKQITSVEQVIN